MMKYNAWDKCTITTQCTAFCALYRLTTFSFVVGKKVLVNIYTCHICRCNIRDGTSNRWGAVHWVVYSFCRLCATFHEGWRRATRVYSRVKLKIQERNAMYLNIESKPIRHHTRHLYLHQVIYKYYYFHCHIQ